MDGISKDLLKIGLTDGESRVYVALSEIGASSVGPIVKKAKVAYSNVYDILNRLLEKGIISFIIKNKTKYFQAVSPKTLVKYLEKKESEIYEQKEILKLIMPKLEQIQHHAPKQDAEVFIGKKGLRTAYTRLNKPGKETIFFYIHHPRYAKESDLFYFSIKDIVMNTSKYRGIANKHSKTSAFFKDKDVKKHFQMKFVDFPIPGNFEICENRLLIVAWQKEVVSVLIESIDIANNFKTYFDSLWKIAYP